MKKVLFVGLQASLSAGIGRYIQDVVHHIDYKCHDFEVDFLIRDEDLKYFETIESTHLVVVKGIRSSVKRNIYEQFLLHKIYNRYDVVHFPDTITPMFRIKPKIVTTFHDISFKALPETFSFGTRVWKNFITQFALKQSDTIISISNYTTKEIEDYYTKAYSHKIQLIYNGYSAPVFKEKDITKIVNKDFVLAVGTLSPRKNYIRLIQAFSKLNSEKDIKLVIVGGEGWLYDDLIKEIEQLGLTKDVIFPGRVDDDLLYSLYKEAKLFVYPSYYEGFGLPPLEAMGVCTPVVASNATSIPEVVASAAAMINPYDVDSIYSGMKKVIDSPEYAEELIERGKERVTAFSWEKCAEALRLCYKALIEG